MFIVAAPFAGDPAQMADNNDSVPARHRPNPLPDRSFPSNTSTDDMVQAAHEATTTATALSSPGISIEFHDGLKPSDDRPALFGHL